MALKAACDYANKARVLACVQQIHHEFTALNINNPRIAVAALNPHGSDNGLFGHEEADNLIPAVKAAQEMGINAIGPVPARFRVPSRQTGALRRHSLAVSRSGAYRL